MLYTIKYVHLNITLNVFDTIYKDLLYKNNEAELCQKVENIPRILRLFSVTNKQGVLMVESGKFFENLLNGGPNKRVGVLIEKSIS